ncbi:zinc finger BED domain-containing protein 5-like [Palaemon carinicauda]|uniref:zinc finger BED domain-containing protein 5-like n=1 Tax=Palaemon carinicauda TaxID=392227 RepID=UPI0035B678C4
MVLVEDLPPPRYTCRPISFVVTFFFVYIIGSQPGGKLPPGGKFSNFSGGVIELRKAIQEFLEQKGYPFATKFTDKEWLARLCYLADIFAELNSGNLQLQGRNTTVIDARHTVAAFLAKLRLWIRRLEKGVIAQFPTLDHFIEENSHDTGSLLQTINKEMSDHLKGLETSMHHYFPESDQETASLQWIIHPFSVPDEAIHDDDFPAKGEWITMRANEA